MQKIDRMKTISILDGTVKHVPHLFSKGDRANLNLGKNEESKPYSMSKNNINL